MVTDSKGNPRATSGPSGYSPSDLQSAYNLTTAAGSNGAGATVAIVDAFDDPTAKSDLDYYRQYCHLPTLNQPGGPTFTKVNQQGQTSPLPRKNAGWALEISLDLDMVSAACPKCNILLVEANSNFFSDLGAAVDYAASKADVVAISNSYGGSEYSGEVKDQEHYNHSGKAITVSSGDSGYGVEFPAAAYYVTAVGGTTLPKNSTGGFGPEKVWSGAGSGCSAYISKPGWRQDPDCTKNRTVADVAADADPNTGAAVYDTTRYQGQSGWFKVGGTSLGSPFIAAVYALAGNTATVTYGSYPYSNRSSLNDIISGNNGNCSGSYLCTGTSGYDGPTGNGTPKGTGGF